MNSHSRRRGFSLIEILVVIAIIGIVMSIAMLSIGILGDDRDLRQSEPIERFRLSINCKAGKCNAVFGLMRLDTLRQTKCIGAYPSSDHILLGELALYGKIVELSESLFLRRDHPGTSMRSNPGLTNVASWFTGSRHILPKFERWRCALEYSRVALRSPLSSIDRLKALNIIVGWVAGNWKDFVIELLLPIYFNGRFTLLGRLLYRVLRPNHPEFRKLVP